MADKTKIEWSDATWNVITGCSVLSPGCKNCYAMKLAGTRLKHHKSREGLTVETKAGPVWNGEVRFNEEWLDQPLRWSKPRMIFVAAHGDLFHESVPDAWIDKVFAVMGLAFVMGRGHTFQVLTKRAARMRGYLCNPETVCRVTRAMKALGPELPGENSPPAWPLPNVHLGVSAENQEAANTRVPDLLMTPAAVRWVSVEPMLGAINLTALMRYERDAGREGEDGWTFCDDALSGFRAHKCGGSMGAKLDWVVCGGESGRDARPMHVDWARRLRDQCAAAGVPFLFKQFGEWAPGTKVEARSGCVETATLFDGKWVHGVENLADEDLHVDDEPDMYRIGKKAAGRLLDGVEHNGYPEGVCHGL